MAPDERYMRLALELARKGVGRTNPNPPVGAVVVKKGRIAGKGFHRKCGLPHAEVIALRQAGRRARGAVLYVTLEPCDHFGRTPPCTRAIIESGIKTVVIGTRDPNPRTRGAGIRRLRRAGIGVIEGVRAEEAAALVRPFGAWITRKRPYVTVKMAQSLDGKIATRTGASRWISSGASRRLVDELRGEADAVMVGSGTLLRDDPRLLSRRARARQPARVVVDTRLRTPPGARILTRCREYPVYIATARDRAGAKARSLGRRGARILFARTKRGRIDLADLLRALARLDIMHLLVEGGGELVAGLLAEGLVDECIFFVAPTIIGGRNAPTAVGGQGVALPAQALRLKDLRVSRRGGDVIIQGRV